VPCVLFFRFSEIIAYIMDKVHEIPIFFVHLLQTRNLIVYLGQKKMVQILKVLSLVKHHN